MTHNFGLLPRISQVLVHLTKVVFVGFVWVVQQLINGTA